MSSDVDAPGYEPFDLSEEPNAPGCEHSHDDAVCAACQQVLHDLAHAQAQRRLVPGPERGFDCIMDRHQGCFGYVNPITNWRGDVLCSCECHVGDGNAPDWERALERAREIRYSGAFVAAEGIGPA